MAPRKAAIPNPPSDTLIIDNGGHTIKAGFQSSGDVPSIIPNCIARDRSKHSFVGSQLSNCKDFGEISFRRPVEKGYIVNWEAQREIWDHEFFSEKSQLKCDPSETGLILTEQPNSLPHLQKICDEMVFEEFGFRSYLRTTGWASLHPPDQQLTSTGPILNAYNDIPAIFKSSARDDTKPRLPAEIILLIDSGYSNTTITPLLNGRPLNSAVRRLDIGGKHLTNYLARLISLRQYDMRADTYLVNDIKEATCYMSRDFKADMEACWKGPKGDRRPIFETAGGIAKDYILPDYHNTKAGRVRDHDPGDAGKLAQLQRGKAGEAAEDILTLRNERFAVPEILFSPSDIGMRQSGIAQLLMDSLSTLPFGLWPGLLANIIVVGGNANIPDFIWRLQAEIRALAPTECGVRVARPADPIISTWSGGKELAGDKELLAKLSVTKADYEEHGGPWVQRRFGGR
jgi:actin-related protein 6